MDTENCQKHPEPSPDNHYLADHVALLVESLHRWTGRNLINLGLSADETARRIFEAPFAVLSHDTAPDPILNYANRSGLRIFELTWHELIVMPSRLTAEAPERHARARLLAEVSAKNFIDNYAGVRVTKNGRRFRIERATVWNLVDENGTKKGQAATFADLTVIS